MKSNLTRNVLVLAACWLLTAGMGVYITFLWQPKELDRIKKAEEVARLSQSEVALLLAEEASSRYKAEEMVRKWRARYKVIPDTLGSPEVIGRLNALTQNGFDHFDVTLVGVERLADYSLYAYDVKGQAYFASLYRFVWDVENDRNLYRVRNLNLRHVDLVEKERGQDVESMRVMVSFSFTLEAYFGGTEGVSAPGTLADGAPAMAPALVPDHVLPPRRPALNPFFPVVMEQLPPNTRQLVDLETASLVAIVGDQAVFADALGNRRLAAGDPVYLGQIVSVDPVEGRVVARLNKGGIVDEVELSLHTGERYRQAIGPVQLAPALEEGE